MKTRLNSVYRAGLAAPFLFAGAAQAEEVEIYLLDMLDNTQNGYCVDIAGGRGADADPVDGLQGHTCYSPAGELLVDQIFDTDMFADNVLYMPEFDVCVQAASVRFRHHGPVRACGRGCRRWSRRGCPARLCGGVGHWRGHDDGRNCGRLVNVSR